MLIRGGIVYDGTGGPEFAADVAVAGERIVRVASAIAGEAAREIDARGRAVLPGLIDPHVHEELTLFVDNRYEPFLRQGVTTLIAGNCGHSVTPGTMESVIEYWFNNGLLSLANRADFKARLPRWTCFAEYVRAAQAARPAVNLAVLLGHGTIRQHAMGGAHDRPPTQDEQARIDRVLREGLEQGAWGVSFGLDYVPSRYATTRELIDVARIVREYDAAVTAHLRHGIGVKAAVEEMVAVCRATQVRTQISHLTSNAEDAFEVVRAAADAGLPVRVDTIPRSSGHCNRKDKLIQSIMAISDSLFAEGVDGVRAALHTPEGRATIRRDARAKFGMDKEKVFVIASDDPSLEGRSVAQIARDRGDADPTETMLDLAGDDNACTFWLGGPLRDDFSRDHGPAITSNPYVCAGSDRIMGDPCDPWFWYELQRPGAFPNFVNMYRAAGVPIAEIVRRNTSMVADHFGMARRGRIAEGAFADVAVIDLERYAFPLPTDADCRDPLATARGVDHVLVNGRVALADGSLTHDYPGRMLLRSDE